MSRARGRQVRVTLAQAVLDQLAQVEPAAADYILDRRRRGVPAAGRARA